ncbi:MAG: Cna B domain-containing protein, partial [bacterium]
LVFGDGGSGTKTYNISAGDGFFVHGNFTAQRQGGSSATILVNGGIFDVVGTTTLGAGYQAGTPAPAFHSITSGMGVISGALYTDLNGDGLKQATDPGLSGRTVELLSGGTVIATTQTGTTGFYQFLNLAPGTYTVRQVVPTGWSQTAAPAGTVSVTAGENSAANFGAFQHLTISGAKYHDLNGDGVRQSDEPGLAGWTFFLYTATGGVVSSAPLQYTTTDVNGDFGFFDLGPLPTGTSYVVAEQLTGDWEQTTPQSSSPNSILMPDGTYGFVVAATSGLAISTGGSASGTGTLKLNARNNSTTATITYNDNAGQAASATVYVSQFNATWNGAGGPTTFNTFCVDLFHAVTVGQTFQATARPDLAPAFTNGSRIAYIYQNYGTQDLSGDPIQAAAVQVAIWALSLDNFVPTQFVDNLNGSWSSADDDENNDPDVFKVAWGSTPNVADIMALVNDYLNKSLDSAAQGGWFDAALAGDGDNRG